MNATGSRWCSVNIGSSNSLVPSGNKVLPEPIFTKFHNAMWVHMAIKSSIPLPRLNVHICYTSLLVDNFWLSKNLIIFQIQNSISLTQVSNDLSRFWLYWCGLHTNRRNPERPSWHLSPIIPICLSICNFCIMRQLSCYIQWSSCVLNAHYATYTWGTSMKGWLSKHAHSALTCPPSLPSG